MCQCHHPLPGFVTGGWERREWNQKEAPRQWEREGRMGMWASNRSYKQQFKLCSPSLANREPLHHWLGNTKIQFGLSAAATQHKSRLTSAVALHPDRPILVVTYLFLISFSLGLCFFHSSLCLSWFFSSLILSIFPWKKFPWYAHLPHIAVHRVGAWEMYVI